ncbi:hypothetical protein [Bifidobacterium miconisargentati]|uniref:hypothetical protein n=1 Tax=Bifidobacterium miconisargentati TaxID=2834437 RepID=UPI001BDD1BB9|nr:hypothetical protein [Bifidobacterium miconisargentati]MBW3089314.1 hypothetical protein [Bifidobacterium miconisargentati]
MPGNHDAIDVTARTRFARGVRFRCTTVRALLEAESLDGEILELEGGKVRCRGVARIRCLTGRGIIEISGNLFCDAIGMTGELRCSGNVHCSGDILVNGKLLSRQHVSGGDITLKGTLTTGTVSGNALVIRPLHSAMFSRFGMTQYEGRSEADQVTVVDLDAGNLRCKLLKADTAILRDGTMVEHAVCETSLSLDASSAVVMLSGKCHRAKHLRSA